MIDHLSTYATDFLSTRRFYTGVMESLGHSLQADMVADWDTEFPTRRIAAWGPDRAVFWVIETLVVPTPRHIAFAAPDRSVVRAFHAAALASGGVDHGAPGLRPIYHPDYYGAFALDPDGNNVEAVCHLPEPSDE